ncbi:MAG: sigma-70 family RNA polymerase sigma factor [Oligoflexia bacterium]|nr:sigma-70 family RNA polymerase sigma factor [Oligoflexia bacterium]
MPAEKTDFQLIEEFRLGQLSSFEELIGRYSEKAFNLAIRITRNQEDAEEVLQDVFVTVFRKSAGFEGKSSFSSWLYRVTMNAALMKLRRNKHTTATINIDDVLPQINLKLVERSSEAVDLDKIALRAQVVTVLEQAINKLPEDYRPVFLLRDVDGLTSREVSKMLGLSVPAVKSRLHRSRLMLRRKLARFFREYKGIGDEPLKRAGNY